MLKTPAELSGTKTIQNLLLLTIALTPLFSLREFLKFSGFSVPHAALYFNLSKDFLLAIVLGLCIVAVLKNKTYPRPLLPFFVVFAAYTLVVAALTLYDPVMVVAGFRWALPLLLLFLLVGHIDQHFLQRLTPVIVFLLFVTTAIQLYQVSTRQFRWGTSTYSELFGRVSGFYELPSTTGFVTCLFFFIIRYYFTGPKWLKYLLLGVAMFSNFLLSISTTGFILMLIMLAFPYLYRPGKYRPLFITLAFMGSVVGYFFLDKLNGRFPGDSSFSWNVRVGLMQGEWQHAQIVSNRFGSASNAVSVLKGALGLSIDGSIVTGGGESFYPPLLGNYGKLFFVLFLALLVFVFVKVVRHRSEPKSLFFFITILGALTVRITEIFPLSVLIAILSAYFISEGDMIYTRGTATTQEQ